MNLSEIREFEKFGELIRTKRLQMGLSQMEMGEYLGGYQPTTMSNWETGKTSPPIEEASRIFKVLGFSLLIGNIEKEAGDKCEVCGCSSNVG